MKDQIVKNLLSNYATNLFGLFLGFLLVPFLLAKLGKEAYGIVILAESMVVFFELAAVNIRMALARHATFAWAKNDKKGFYELLSTGHVLFTAFAILVLGAGIFLSLQFWHVFRVPEYLRTQSSLLFLFITASVVVNVLNMAYWSMLYTRHRFDLINLSVSTGVILRALSLFLMFSLLPERYVTLTTYGFTFLLMVLAQNISVHLWHARIMPQVRPSFDHFRAARMREILSYSSYSSIAQVSTLLYQNTANILINLFWGPGANAIYSIAMRLPSILTRFFQDATWSLTSTFNQLVARRDERRVQSLYHMYTTLLVMTITPLAITLIVFAKPFIRLWVGPEYEEAAALVPYLVIPLLLQLPLSISGCLNNSFAQVKVPSIVSLTAAVLNVGLGIYLGQGLEMGLTGIALSSAICLILYTTLFSPFYACSIAGIPYRPYMAQAFLIPLAWSAAMGSFACLIVRLLIDVRQVPVAVFAALVFTAAYAAISYRVVLTPPQRKMLRGLITPFSDFLKGHTSNKPQKPVILKKWEIQYDEPNDKIGSLRA